MEQEFDLRTYVSILRRRQLYLFLPIVPIIVLACAVAYVMPPVFDASAKILVQSQQIPTELARPTVITNASRQIEIIRQRLMTRANLLEIASKFNLYPKLQASRSLSQIVEKMREDTLIEQIGVGPRRNQQAIAFSVSFSHGNAQKTSSVTNEFVALILEHNIKTRTNRAAETHRFFVQQVARLDKDLAAQEALIVGFKRKNEEALPENLGYRRVLHTRLQSEISDIDREIGTLELERDRLIQEAEGAVTTEEVNATEAELARLKLQLTQLRAVYSERHPSVRKMKNRLKALEKTSAEESNAQNAKAPDETKSVRSATTRSSYQLTTIERKISDLSARRAIARGKITEVEESILKTPQIDVALKKLTREYELLQSQQRSAQSKVAEAATGELLEESRQAERFEVIERATTPSAPTKPNRPLIIAGGLFISIAAGLGLVLLLELLDGSIRRARDLETRLGMRSIATIPLVTTIDERSSGKRKKVVFVLAALASVLVALACIHLFYRPLDLLMIQLMQRIGI